MIITQKLLCRATNLNSDQLAALLAREGVHLRDIVYSHFLGLVTKRCEFIYNVATQTLPDQPEQWRYIVVWFDKGPTLRAKLHEWEPHA